MSVPHPEDFWQVSRRLPRLLKALRGWAWPVLLLLVPQTQAWAGECNAVLIQPSKPLLFGNLGLGAKGRGWMVLDQGGGYAVSNDLAMLGKLAPSPGLFRVTAPSGSLVMLRIAVASGDHPAAALSGFSVGFRGAPLALNGDHWLLRMPDSATKEAPSVEVSVGARLVLDMARNIKAVKFSLSLECVGTLPR